MASGDDVGPRQLLAAFIGLCFAGGSAGLIRAHASSRFRGREIVLWALQ